MQITVNGEPQTHPDGLSVADLLAHLDLAGKPCAVEVSKSLVPKRDHAEHRLAEGDAVEIVTLVGGG
ncbi:MAG: sulfur carrier protein ThiS [Planctomycetota bacterium]